MVNAEELHHPDDFVVVTVDIEDCPLAELPLAEIFDVTTSTLNIDYLVTLREYITQQLEDTSWLDDQSMTPLFDAGFATFFRKPNGDIVSMRKPALQRLIAQTLRDRTDNLSPISIPIFIRFLIPDNTRPTRVIVGVGTTVPSVIGGTGTVRSPGVAANRRTAVASRVDDDLSDVESPTEDAPRALGIHDSDEVASSSPRPPMYLEQLFVVCPSTSLPQPTSIATMTTMITRHHLTSAMAAHIAEAIIKNTNQREDA
jgi:hypothetical protein